MSEPCPKCGAPANDVSFSKWEFDRAAVLREFIEGLSEEQGRELAKSVDYAFNEANVHWLVALQVRLKRLAGIE